ncbi:MAG TPA: TonB-dependent receptor [Thermoanaerobaculia bacterium]|nr:TonB-dependent receptor [Thermoanaerobaculia bacterium]
MRGRSIAAYLIVLAVAFLAASSLYADGTLLGTIGGRVVDQEGKVLPGATVELISLDKGFTRSIVTDAVGAFNFPLLQPGPYTVKVSLAGFQSVEVKGNTVSPEKTTAVNVTLKLAATAESVTVTGEAPLVDKTNTAATTKVDSTLTQTLAVARNYQTLINFAPGVTSVNGSGNPNSHGATNMSNLYLFDGVDTTDTTTGTFGQNFNFEAIQEVNISTTGISADYGRSQGAYVNVITKSGTNQLHGSFKAILTNDNWNSQNKGVNPTNCSLPNQPAPCGTPWARTKADVLVDDNAATLGGPIWQDHIWFFGAYEWVNNTAPPAQTATSQIYPGQTGQSYTQVTNVRLWDGKLTGQVTPSQLLTAQFNSDPITGFIVDYWGASADLGALTGQGQNACSGFGCLGSIRWSGVFGSKISAEAGWSNAGGNITVAPYSGDGTPYYSAGDQLYYNGATFTGIVFRPRTQANLSGSLYHELFGKAAQLKLGVDYQQLRSENDFQYPTNNLYYITQYNPTVPAANQVFQVGDEWDQFINPQPSTSRGKIWGFYGLEKFELDRLSLNLGVRVDYQTADSDLGGVVMNSTNWSPRLSAAYDVMGDGKTLVSAGFGTYYQWVVQNLADSIYAGVPQQVNKNIYLWDGSQWVFDRTVNVGGNNQPVNTNLEPSYSNQFNIAVQQQIGSTMAFGIRGIYSKWYNLIDDVKHFDGEQEITTPQNFPSDLVQRSYKAIELTFEKRFSGNWQALLTYTLGRAYGNQFPAGGAVATQLYDFPGSTCNVTGVGPIDCAVAANTNQNSLAPYDRTSILNAFAAYTWNFPIVNLTAAPSVLLSSGIPYAPQRTFRFPDGTNALYYYAPDVTQRTPTYYQANFALEALFKPFGGGSYSIVGGPIEIGFKGEIFNITNQQPVIRNNSTSITLTPGPNLGLARTRTALLPPRTYRITGMVRF